MCDECLLQPPVQVIKFVCDVSYSSPAGRNSYNREKLYSYPDIVEGYEILANQERQRQTREYQRSIMTSSMRYDIMKRDGFKCVLCGRTAEDGVKLHVDHIVPVSKGGKTVPSNLRTLCEDCNIGKRDKYDDEGVN